MPLPVPPTTKTINVYNELGALVPAPTTVPYGVAANYAQPMVRGQIVTDVGSGNIELAEPGDSVLGITWTIYAANGRTKFTNDYKPASTAAVVHVVPFSLGYSIGLLEDGVGGVLATPTGFIDIVLASVNTPNSGTVLVQYDEIQQWDSSTNAGSVGSLCFQLYGREALADNWRTPSDTTSLLRYLGRPVAAKIQAANPV